MPDSEALVADAQLLFDTVRSAGDLGKSLSRKSVQKWSKHGAT